MVESRLDGLQEVEADTRAEYETADRTIAIIKCGSCGRVYVGGMGRNLPAQSLWPLATAPVPEGVPPKVAEAYKDALIASAAGSKIGALMAGRTVLTRMLRDREADNFKQLVERNELTPSLYGVADQLRLWAAVAGHDDVEVDAFSMEEVQGILEYLETILQTLYTHTAKAKELVEKTKSLKKKGN